jgi:hypothetical protein
MIKLIIKQEDKQTFQKLFKFFWDYECELCLFPDGLHWRNHCADGIVYPKAFSEYPFNYRRRLGIVKKNGVKLSDWFKEWEEIKDTSRRIEIPIGS